ncbi:MAG: MmcQ/YjbR family DNA-binding protein [Prevotellaceae bacterium]|jgi:predicted DNA-binding protein (MmcQ/YjbR family)|nr:MmcQ/YjbR family DNA-binding protein [Prevotellaceae bacterium]
MNIEELRLFCLEQKDATECLPFDEFTLVFKVMGKMFALIPLDEVCELKICLKCDPEKAIELREQYEAVTPAYHFNKKYWNTILPNRDMNDDLVKKWILHSIDEVVKKLPKKQRDAYRLKD